MAADDTGSPGVGFASLGGTALLTLMLEGVATYYGQELARGLEELAKTLPGAVAAFLRDHPASDPQWDPKVNPQP